MARHRTIRKNRGSFVRRWLSQLWFFCLLGGCLLGMAAWSGEQPAGNQAQPAGNQEQPLAAEQNESLSAKQAERQPVEKVAAAAEPPSYQRGVVIEFDGEITQWMEGYFLRKLARAKRAGCDLVIVQIKSPGGLLIESQNLAESLRDADGIHTVAFVPHSAISGGAYVALGCDEIVMHPEANLGDIGVIFMEYDAYQYVPEKLVSPVVTQIRALAEHHGRSPALCESMVDKDCEVYRFVQVDGREEKFMTEKEWESQANKDEWAKKELILESAKGKFLTVGGKRAVALKLAAGTADSLADVQARFNVKEKQWLHYQPDTIDRAVYVLTLWWVTGLLFLVGFIGMVYELAAPGTCLGGLAALTCFSLFFWSRFLVGTSGLLELVLFLLALVFLAVEIFVLPGFGVSGVAGILLLGISLVLACQTFIIPETQAQWESLGVSLSLVGGVAFTLMILGVAAIQWFGSIPFFNRLILMPETDRAAGDLAGDSALEKELPPVRVGERGRAEYPLRPTGRARFGDQFLNVVSDQQFISQGATVEVICVEDGTIRVREVDGAS